MIARVTRWLSRRTSRARIRAVAMPRIRPMPVNVRPDRGRGEVHHG